VVDLGFYSNSDLIRIGVNLFRRYLPAANNASLACFKSSKASTQQAEARQRFASPLTRKSALRLSSFRQQNAAKEIDQRKDERD
jgi:hypothetical protein